MSDESEAFKDVHSQMNQLIAENTALKNELASLKLRVNSLVVENQELRRNSVSMQAQVEQEEEFISNTLLKQIQALKKEKESLALNYEQEEEYITNELSRKLIHLQQEKLALESTLTREQETQVSKLNERISKLEADVKSKQESLETLKREKIQLENTLEQEQEALVNKLWKKMERLESEKRILKNRLESVTSSPMNADEMNVDESNAGPMSMESSITNSRSRNPSSSRIPSKIPFSLYKRANESNSSVESSAIEMSGEDMAVSAACLHEEVKRLRRLLVQHQKEYPQKIRAIREEERAILEENQRLRCHLQREVERRRELSRNFSESESSIEMDEERLFNDRVRRESSGTAPTQSSSRCVPSPRAPLSKSSDLSDQEVMSSNEFPASIGGRIVSD